MKINTILIIIFYLVALSSCMAKKLTQSTKRVQAIKEINKASAKKIDSIATVEQKKFKEGTVDSTLSSLFRKKIQALQKETDSLLQQTKQLEELLGNKKLFKEQYETVVLPKLQLLEEYKTANNRRMKVLLMLEAGLNVANFNLFDLAAFYGPGKYVIPKDKEEIAAKSFAPMLDSIISFSNKYSNIPRTATLVILGFADGQRFNNDNVNYEIIKQESGKTNPTNADLNATLSQLRAQELINVLTVKFLNRTPQINGFELFKIEYLGKGRGEQLPLPTIKDYKIEDARRRIVLCYWAVLPD